MLIMSPYLWICLLFLLKFTADLGFWSDITSSYYELSGHFVSRPEIMSFEAKFETKFSYIPILRELFGLINLFLWTSEFFDIEPGSMALFGCKLRVFICSISKARSSCDNYSLCFTETSTPPAFEIFSKIELYFSSNFFACWVKIPM